AGPAIRTPQSADATGAAHLARGVGFADPAHQPVIAARAAVEAHQSTDIAAAPDITTRVAVADGGVEAVVSDQSADIARAAHLAAGVAVAHVADDPIA